MANPISSFKVTSRNGQDVDEVLDNAAKSASEGTSNALESSKTNAGGNDKEPSSTDATSTKEPVIAVPENKPTIQEIISQKTNGSFKDLDEILTALSETSKPKEPQAPKFKDDYIKKIVDYYENTGTLEPVLKALTTDYKKVSDEDMFRMDLRERYPNLSEKGVQKIYQKEIIGKYNLDEENNDLEDVELGRELFAHDANKLREAKIKAQAEFKVPQSNKQDNTQDQNLLKEAHEKFKNTITTDPSTKELLNSKRVTVKQGNNGFNFDVAYPEKIAEMASDDAKFFQLFVKDSKLDLGKYYKVMAYASDMDAFENALITYGKSLDRNALHKELKNTKEPLKEPGTAPDGADSDEKLGLLKAFAERGVHS